MTRLLASLVVGCLIAISDAATRKDVNGRVGQDVRSQELPTEEQCYKPPRNILWRLARSNNVTALQKALGKRPSEVDVRFSCLRNQTLLHQAASKGAHDTVAWLLDRGAKLEARDMDGRTPLLEAAWGGRNKVVKVLLDRGADPAAVDNTGRGALHLAVAHPRLLERLLRKKLGRPDAVDKTGETPLHRAAAVGKEMSVSFLVRSGFPVDAVNKAGETALHLALVHRNLNATRLLLESGADANRALPDGRRPLHLALEGNGESAARLLLDHGALANPPLLGQVKNPLATAMEKGRGRLVELIKSRGGVP